MAHKTSAGSTKLGRDSIGKRLGVKINHDQKAKAGQIIIRQRGLKYLPGKNVRRAGDDSLYAIVDGVVRFKDARKTRFDGSVRKLKRVSVEA
ncbi:MAG: 50S ribosomal protein L27 [Candidatus Paceibacterota bacterium]